MNPLPQLVLHNEDDDDDEKSRHNNRWQTQIVSEPARSKLLGQESIGAFVAGRHCEGREHVDSTKF